MLQMKTKSTEKQNKDSFITSRYIILCLGILFCLAVLLVRVADLQFLNHPMLTREAGRQERWSTGDERTFARCGGRSGKSGWR